MAEHDAEKADIARVEQKSGSLMDQPDVKMTTGQYLRSRFTTLKPTWTIPPSPFKLLGLLTRKNWLFFAVGGV